MQKHFSIFILLATIVSCSEQQQSSASETFLEYHELSKTNTDFEVEMAFYSNTQAAKLKAKMPSYMKSMKVDTEAEAMAKYLSFISGTAKCMDLKVIDEEQTLVSAVIKYSVNDLCSGHKGAVQKVAMIYENGWKIESTELIL